MTLSPKSRAAETARMIRVACVGDSITYGSKVEDRARNNYPKVLNEILGKNFEIKNFGVSGATMLKGGNKPYWNLPQFKAVAEFEPDAVVIALGTNDSKPNNWKSKSDFANDARAMIEHFQNLATKPRVWICLPPPVFQKDEDGINEETIKEEIIPEIMRVAQELKIPIIDLHDAMKGHSKLFPDGIHPNAAGAKVIAEIVAKSLGTLELQKTTK